MKNTPVFFVAAYFEKEYLKRQQSREDEGIDVDDAIEKLDITDHNPQKYLDMLKQSVEGNPSSPVKVRSHQNVCSAPFRRYACLRVAFLHLSMFFPSFLSGGC